MSNRAPVLKIEQGIDPEILKAIGLLLVVASNIEHALTFQLLRIISRDRIPPLRVMPLLSGMETRVKLASIQSIAAMVTPAAIPAIRKACDKLSNALQRRNDLAHGFITHGRTSDEIGLQVVRFYRDKLGTPPISYIKTKQIRRYSEILSHRAVQLDEVLSSAGYAALQNAKDI